VKEAIDCYHRSIELDPTYAYAYVGLGNAEFGKEKYDEALVHYQKAVALDPRIANAHYNLGNVLRVKRRFQDAIACLRKAISLDPKDAMTHGTLGLTLIQQGQFAEAEKSFRRALELVPPEHPLHRGAADQLKQIQLFQTQEGKLLEVLAGKAKPATVTEQLQLARLCLMTRRVATGARLYTEAFKSDAKQAEDLALAHRYYAACAAALAGCGKDRDAEKVDEKERMRWRKQAVDWLRADLTLGRKQLKSGAPGDAGKVRTALRYWQNDPDLAGLREAEALKKLSPEEAEAYRRLWADVAELLKQADRAAG
jgi:Flp pilus assembly protein TadD